MSPCQETSGQWQVTSLRDVCVDVRYGYTAAATSEPTGTHFIRVTDIAQDYFDLKTVPFCHINARDAERHRLNVGDILISRMGTIGVSTCIREPISAVPASYLIRHRLHLDAVDPQYLSYVLQTPEYWHFIEAYGSSGAVQPNINAKTLGDFRFPLPPLKEQRRIAEVLGALDDKIELNRRMNRTLEEVARAIFKDWFVDFGPVRAKMEGQEPYLPQEIWSLFPNNLQDSELGPIPQTWQIMELGDMTSKPQYGYTASATQGPDGPKFLRISDINKSAWIDWSLVPHCHINIEDFRKFRLDKGDILVARMADPGHGCLVESEHRAVFASYLIRFRPRIPNYARFLQYWLRSSPYWDLVNERGAGSTRATLNASVLSRFAIVVPPVALLEHFSDAVISSRERITSNVAECQHLSLQREALLPELIGGRMRFAEATDLI